MKVDSELQLSYNNFIRSLNALTKDVERNRKVLELDPYPSSSILAQLASEVYTAKGQDSNRDYEKKLNLPEGWKLLTTACNPSKTNGYFGAAYWNPSLQQIVVAHRGTELSNTGAMCTNLMGVVFKNYTSRMSSAITFADKVKTTLLEVNKQKGRRLHLSITGHSLGGWLSQVTAFSLKYLQRKNGNFVKILDHRDRLHVHTVVFDSPGCQKMLNKIIDNCDFRHRRTVSFDTLDITSFQASPNLINTHGSHVGIIYRVLIDVKKFGILQKNTFLYTLATHKMANFVHFFQTLNKEEILENREALENDKIVEVWDWPTSSEYFTFHANVKHKNNYQPELTAEEDQKFWNKKIRYKTEESKNSQKLSVFSEDELLLLEFWSAFRKEKVKLNILEDFVTRHDLGRIQDLIANYRIDSKNNLLICDSKKCLKKVINHTKLLMRWFSEELMNAMRRQSAKLPLAVHLVYHMESRHYLDSLPECHMHFRDYVGLQDFLESRAHRILYIKTKDNKFEVAVLHNILDQIQEQWRQHPDEFNTLDKYLQINHQTFLDWKQLLNLREFVDIGNLDESDFIYDHLLVLDCTSLTDISHEFTDLFEEVLKNASNNLNKKIVLISTQQIDLEVYLNSFNMLVKIVPFRQIELINLAEESAFLSRKLLAIGGQMLGLKEFAGTDCKFSDFLKDVNDSLDTEMLKNMVTNQNYMIEIEDPLVNFINLDVNYSKINKRVSEKSVTRVLQKCSLGTVLIISGLSREQLRTEGRWRELAEMEQVGEERIITTTTEDGPQIFKQKCHEYLDQIIYWFHVSAEQITCKQVFNKDFYIRRRFNHSVVADLNNIDKFIKQGDFNDLLVFQNVDKEILMSSVFKSKTKVETLLRYDKIQIAASAEEVEEIININYDRPVHFLKYEMNSRLVWQRSLGSLDGLRPYVTLDLDKAIEERDLCEGRNKVVIIIGEPGMGKSTSLTRISWLIKSAWVIYVDLKHLQTENLPLEFNIDALSTVANILLTKSKCNNNLLGVMLEYCLKCENSLTVFLLFDAFDEIKESSVPGDNAQEKVIKLLRFLKDQTTANIFVTSREGSRNILENKLSTFATKFEMIGKHCQEDFLIKFLRTHLELELEDFGEKEEKDLQRYVKELHIEAKDVLDASATRFMGIPLQMWMLAEVSLPKAKILGKLPDVDHNPFNIKNMFELYWEFINIKFNIYLRDKVGVLAPYPSFEKATFDSIIENHRVLSIQVLFPEFPKEYLKHINDEGLIELYRFGLIQPSLVGGAEFFHRTFAEYFCADLIIHWLDQQGRVNGSYHLGELFISKILLQHSCKMIRSLIDAQICKSPSPNNSTNFFSKLIQQLWDVKNYIFFDHHCQTIFHVAIKERNHHILHYLLNEINTEATRGVYISLLAARDEHEQTALSMTAQNVIISSSTDEKMAYHKFMEKIVLSAETCSFEMKEKLIFATFANNNITVNKILIEYLHGRHVGSDTKAAFNRVQNVLREEIKPFLEAVISNRMTAVEIIYNRLHNDTERHYLQLAADIKGNTALHIAAELGHLDLVKFLLSKKVPEVLLSFNYLAGLTPLHVAALAGHLSVVKVLVECGASVHIRSKHGRTALSEAARGGHVPVMEYLVQQGARIDSRDNNGYTALSVAARSGHLPAVEFLVYHNADINSHNNEGATPLSLADDRGHSAVREFLIQWYNDDDRL